jgi:hypothetical protein
MDTTTMTATLSPAAALARHDHRSDALRLRLKDGTQFLIDPQDASLLGTYVWHVQNGYVSRRLHRDGCSTTVYLHRLILGIQGKEKTDHINGDKLDNRRANLRGVTQAQNQQNRKGPPKNSTTGVRGVSRTAYGRYRAAVRVNGKQIWLGSFPTLEEAAEAARAGRRRLMTHSIL